MSNHRTRIKSATTKKRPRRHLLFVYGALIVAGIVLLILGQSGIGRRPDTTPAKTAAHNKHKASAATDSSPTPKEAELAANGPVLVDDDGKTLWQSPTSGPPLKLSYLPPGVQFILAIRPESIAEHEDGEKVINSLGPTEERAWKMLSNDLPTPSGIHQAIIGFGATSDGKWSVTEVVRLSAAEKAAGYFASHFPNAEKKSHHGVTYWLNGERAYYLPDAADKNTIVVAPPDAIADIIDLAGDPPPLRRDIERLLSYTDADRDITVVVSPNSLFSEGRSMFEGEMSRLRAPLFWFLGDELSAAALSLDWGDNFFVELIATPTLDTPPERAARILAERVAEIPDKLEAYVVGLQPQPYGRMIVARFPAMFRKLSTYTRSGYDSDHVVLNAYMPSVAGHNLLMGTELTLAEMPGGVGTVAEATSPLDGNAGGATSVAGKLRQRTTLRFTRDTLDAALRQLSQDIGVEIIIRGPDLQADGITKNQSFGIDVADKPAEEVLIEILRLANPDKTATGPNDLKQKLVFVIGPGDDGGERIFVTTRAAATTRGEELPGAFRAANP